MKTAAEPVVFKTPAIPPWVHKLSHPLYRNISSFRLGNRHLWGTETLLGDWDGEYLLIAKDFYPAQYIDERLEVGDPNPYSHNPKAPTNKNLLKTLCHLCLPNSSVKAEQSRRSNSSTVIQRMTIG